MARLTVTVEGEVEEVREALLRLFNGEPVSSGDPKPDSPPGSQSTSEEEPKPSPEPPLDWTSEELARLWAYLTDPARRVLGEVAGQPNGYPLADLERALGSDMRRIGGNLSSVGHAMRRLYRVGDAYTRPWPILKDGYKRVYLMDESVAASIRELVAQSGEDDAAEIGDDE
jgi:hypothetical protein